MIQPAYLCIKPFLAVSVIYTIHVIGNYCIFTTVLSQKYHSRNQWLTLHTRNIIAFHKQRVNCTNSNTKRTITHCFSSIQELPERTEGHSEIILQLLAVRSHLLNEVIHHYSLRMLPLTLGSRDKWERRWSVQDVAITQITLSR